MGTIVHLIHQVLAKPTIQDITTVTHANNITGYSTGVESKHQHGHCCYCLCMVSNFGEFRDKNYAKHLSLICPPISRIGTKIMKGILFCN